MRGTLLSVGPFIPLGLIALHMFTRQGHAKLAAWTQSLFGLFLAALALPSFVSDAPRVAVDGFSMMITGSGTVFKTALYLDARNSAFVLLLGLCLPIIFVFIRPRTEVKPSYYISANILIGSLLGVFIANSLLLFYLFWEMALLGAYFWIGLHGQRREDTPALYTALMRFVLITLFGSLPMLMAIAIVILPSGDVALADLGRSISILSPELRGLAFWGFLLGFGVKLPLVGLHGWLRDTYAVAPPACRALLSAIMSKMGAYGLLIVLVPAFGSEFGTWGPTLMAVAAAGAIYGGVVCLGRDRLTDVLAYSSLAHLSLVALAAFAGTRGDASDSSAITAGIFQVFNHGLIMAFLFALDDRISVDGRGILMSEVGGLRAGQGRLTALMLVAMFAAASLPGLSNFAGEILVYFAAFRVSPWYTFAAGAGALITAAAMIRIFHHLFFGARRGNVVQAADLRIPEVALGLAVVSVWLVLGLYPMLFVGPVERAFATVVAGVVP